MPKIDFYILSEGTCMQLACNLIEKAYKNQRRIYIHTENQSIAHELDELLWTYKVESFIPHNLCGEGPDSAPPVQIGFTEPPQQQRDILINLTHHIPAFYKQFARIIEIVPNDENIQALARENYRAYRAQGYDINTHKLQTLEA